MLVYIYVLAAHTIDITPLVDFALVNIIHLLKEQMKVKLFIIDFYTYAFIILPLGLIEQTLKSIRLNMWVQMCLSKFISCIYDEDTRCKANTEQ